MAWQLRAIEFACDENVRVARSCGPALHDLTVMTQLQFHAAALGMVEEEADGTLRVLETLTGEWTQRYQQNVTENTNGPLSERYAFA